MKDIMIDIETLGVRYNAAIIQIGACFFDRATGATGAKFEATIGYDAATLDKFTTDYSTISWWFKQSPEARDGVTGDPAELLSVLKELVIFLRHQGTDVTLWSHATFDMPIIVNALETMGLKMPISFRNMRDIRTIMDISEHHSDAVRDGAHHTALSDAMFQAKYVSEAIQKLKGNNAKSE